MLSNRDRSQRQGAFGDNNDSIYRNILKDIKVHFVSHFGRRGRYCAIKS